MATKNMTNIGEKIKRLRETAKVTQTQLAEFLSIDQSLISKIEKGERSISSDMLSNIATLFCYPLSKLLTERWRMVLPTSIMRRWFISLLKRKRTM